MLLLLFFIFGTGAGGGERQEAAARDFLTELYRVSDYEFYSDLFDNEQEPQERPEIFDDFIELYAPYTTEEGLEQVFANRIAMAPELLAFENGLTLEVRDIILQVSALEKDLIQYDYSVEIEAVSEKDNELRTAVVKGVITIKEISPKEYRVDFMRVTDDSELRSLSRITGIDIAVKPPVPAVDSVKDRTDHSGISIGPSDEAALKDPDVQVYTIESAEDVAENPPNYPSGRENYTSDAALRQESDIVKEEPPLINLITQGYENISIYNSSLGEQIIEEGERLYLIDDDGNEVYMGAAWMINSGKNRKQYVLHSFDYNVSIGGPLPNVNPAIEIDYMDKGDFIKSLVYNVNDISSISLLIKSTGDTILNTNNGETILPEYIPQQELDKLNIPRRNEN